MPVISASNKGGTSVDSSDWLTKKKQAILQASYDQKTYTQIANKSFGSDTVSNLVWKNCAEACPNSVSGGGGDVILPLGTFTLTCNTFPTFTLNGECTVVNTVTIKNGATTSGSNTTFDFLDGDFPTIVIIDRSQPLTMEGLTNLFVLNCGNDDIRTLNLTGLRNLTNLFCGSNFITSLDVSRLINLIDLECTNNRITVVEANKILNALPVVTGQPGTCRIIRQQGGDLTGLIDISSKNWLVT